MRVLLLPHRFPPHGRGGVETWASGLAEGLSGLGATPIVATRDDREGGGMPFAVREETTLSGVSVFWIRHRHTDARTWRDTWSDPRMEGALRTVFRVARPDVVHLGHADGFGVAPLRIAREMGVPLVVTLHDAKWFCGRGQMVTPGGHVCTQASEDRCVRCLAGQLRRGPLRGGLTRLAPAALRDAFGTKDANTLLEDRGDPGLLARRRWRVRQAALRTVLEGADALLSPSRFLGELAVRHGAPQAQVLSNGGPAPTRAPLPSGPLRVGWFGVPSPTKGLDVLVEAVRGLPNVHIEAHGVDAVPDAPHVTARGTYAPEEVVERMAGVHVVAIPSTWPENQPLVALEARAAGRPLLASRIGGLPELVRDGVDGWLLPPGDVAAWRSRLQTLALAPEVVAEAAARSTAPWLGEGHARACAKIYLALVGRSLPSFDPDTARPPQ